MKKTIFKQITFIFALILCFAFGTNAQAASKTQIKAAYKKVLQKSKYNYGYTKCSIVDIDRNGVKEMILFDSSSMEVYTYSNGSAKCIYKGSGSCNAFYYNKAKKTLIKYYTRSHGRTAAFRKYYTYYKMTNGKLREVKCEMRSSAPAGYKKLTMTKISKSRINSILSKY